MAPTRSARCAIMRIRATDMAMAFHRLKDRDWLDYATLAFVAALSVGLYLV
jgi:hypothetical protein